MLEITFCWRKRCSQAHRLSNSISTKYAAGERVKAKSILLLDHVSACSSGNSDILKKLKNLFIVSNFEDLTTLRSIIHLIRKKSSGLFFLLLNFLLSIRHSCKDLY